MSGKRRKRKKKRGRALTAAAVCLLMAGAALLLFPVITDWMYRDRTEGEYRDFMQWSRSDAEPDSLEQLYRELVRRNEELYADGQQDLDDPFSYQQPEVDLSAYGLEGNIIGFVSIEKMGVRLPILLGASEENMKQGAAHLTNTSYPVGGRNTNCVLAAHRGYSRTAMFRDIELLEPGDEVVIENFRETLVYEVTETKVIAPDEIQEVLIQEGKDMVTLITCHPYRENRQRYVVYCERKADRISYSDLCHPKGAWYNFS